MLRKPDESDQAMMAPVRIVALDRARTFVTLLVLLHHSVINYTYFGHGDPMRWLGFDLVVLFNDSFFMAFMFFISGLFVRHALVRRAGAKGGGGLLAPTCVAARRAVPDIYFRADADRLLSVIPALPLAGNDGFQLPAFLVAHARRRTLPLSSALRLV